MASNIFSLAGKTVFITGASRGIGKAIGLRCAQEGANVVVAAKTVEKHASLEGTIYTAAEEMEKAGGKALAVKLDIREPESIVEGVEQAVKAFGGIDIVVNNASAISLTNTADTTVKRYDLMQQVNGRGSFLTTQACLPHLKKSKNPHVLTLSPPLNLNPRWFKNHVAYTTAKYAMSMNTLAWAEEFRPFRIAANSLWPRTAIATAAMKMLGGADCLNECRTPQIVSDAAFYILTSPSDRVTGNFFIDDEVVLKHDPAANLDRYAVVPGSKLIHDFFLDESQVEFVQAAPNQTASRTASPSSSAAPSFSIDNFFDQVRAKFETSDKFRSLECVFKFEIDVGKSTASTWIVDMAAGTVEKTTDPSATADCTIQTTHNVMFSLANKTLKPEVAFLKGDLKIKGKMDYALKLAKLF